MVGIRGSLAYQTSKAMEIGIVKDLAVGLGPRGIRVNAIAPGYFATPTTDAEAVHEPDYYRDFVKRIPLGRAGIAAEIVSPVIFLVSDASSHVSGHVLVIDGATTAHPLTL